MISLTQFVGEGANVAALATAVLGAATFVSTQAATRNLDKGVQQLRTELKADIKDLKTDIFVWVLLGLTTGVIVIKALQL